MRRLLSGTGSQVSIWNFSVEDLQHFDCLMFDFAGTAFMDAIMTDRGVILLDSGLRQFSFEGYELLKKRVSIIHGYQNDQNLFRVNKNDLFQSITEVSIKNWSDEAETFAQQYF